MRLARPTVLGPWFVRRRSRGFGSCSGGAREDESKRRWRHRTPNNPRDLRPTGRRWESPPFTTSLANPLRHLQRHRSRRVIHSSPVDDRAAAGYLERDCLIGAERGGQESENGNWWKTSGAKTRVMVLTSIPEGSCRWMERVAPVPRVRIPILNRSRDGSAGVMSVPRMPVEMASAGSTVGMWRRFIDEVSVTVVTITGGGADGCEDVHRGQAVITGAIVVVANGASE